MNRKVNQERTDCTMADLKSQCRQAIKRLAKFKGSAHKSMTNSTGRSHEGTGTALLARLLIQAPELLSDAGFLHSKTVPFFVTAPKLDIVASPIYAQGRLFP